MFTSQETRYATHVFFAPLPKEGYHERLQYFMTIEPADTTYFWGAGNTPYSQSQIDTFIENKQIKALKKPVELTPATELYLSHDGHIHKGPFEHPETGMEFIEEI